MFKMYLYTAVRSLLRNRSTTLINITGLSVGMAAAVLISVWVQNEINFDNYHPNADRIFRVTTNLAANNWVWETTPLLLSDAIKKEVPEIEKTARLNDGNWPVIHINGSPSYEKSCAYVDGDWFRMFHYDLIEGNMTGLDSDPFGVILTASAARKYFGARNAVGSTMLIDSTNYVVKAIVADPPVNSSFRYTTFLPLSNLLADHQRKENDSQWGNFNYITFIRLKANSNSATVTRKINEVLQKNKGDKEVYVSLIGLKDMHFETGLLSSGFIHGSRNTVYIFSILAFLLLLIACINYVNLTTAKASTRAREVSVRKIVGAQRTHLFFQFVSESLLLGVVSLMVTLLLVYATLPLFNNLTGKYFQLTLASTAIWKIVLTTIFIASLLNSIYPALLLSSFKPLNVFRGVTLLKIKDAYFRKSLVTVQFMVSVMLIAATLVIYRQMQFVQHSDPGYNRSQVLSFAVPDNIDRNIKSSLLQTLKWELLAKSSILGVTTANQPIVHIGSISTGSADWDGHDTTYNPKIIQLSADADFVTTMEVQMKAGRWFEPGSIADKNNVILNETAVKELSIHTPVIGQRFTFKGRTGQVIGVVKDFHYGSMHDKIGPLVAFNDPSWYSFFLVRIAPGSVGHAIRHIEQSWKKQFPSSPLEYTFLEDGFNELYQEDQQASTLVLVFAIIAVFISSLGLFGLAAFAATQRTKEIGIRKVLGATVPSIMALLSKDFVKLIAIAIVTGTPVAWFAMNRWLEKYAYRIDIEWWMFGLAGVIALSIALAITSLQAVQAATTNPVKRLRAE